MNDYPMKGYVQLGPNEYARIRSWREVDLDEEEIYFEGERLTEERAEALAEDIARRHGLRNGRPPLSEEGTSRIGLRIPTPISKALKSKAKELGITQSQAARMAIEAWLEAA
jgi:hypothetical protein